MTAHHFYLGLPKTVSAKVPAPYSGASSDLFDGSTGSSGKSHLIVSKSGQDRGASLGLEDIAPGCLQGSTLQRGWVQVPGSRKGRVSRHAESNYARDTLLWNRCEGTIRKRAGGSMQGERHGYEIMEVAETSRCQLARFGTQ